MMKRLRRQNIPKLAVITSMSVLLLVCLLITQRSNRANASGVTGFNAGNIISDAVMTNYNSMSASQIQSWLNSKAPTCDTNGVKSISYPYNSSTGRVWNYNDPIVTTSRKTYAARYNSWAHNGLTDNTFTCLYQYSSGGVSSAQMIYNAAQKWDINPQVFLVLLQKEQGMITDDWPMKANYQTATGYGCPDTAPCDTQYYGLANQLDWAGKLFRSVINQSPTWYSPYYVGNQPIAYNPISGCGSSNVNIQNWSTAALYDYTPYQPNQAALNAGWGNGDSCSAYGNRNFYLYFTSWFGSTQSSTPWVWQLNSNVISDNDTYATSFTHTITVTPNTPLYLTIKARNTGFQTWNQSTMHLGTVNPRDHLSNFYDSSWFNDIRPAQLSEASVQSGDVGTFTAILKAPSTTGSYSESFGLVAEHIAWLNGPIITYNINVVDPVNASNTNNVLLPGQSLTTGQYLLSPDTQTVLVLQKDGNLVLYSNHVAVWSSGTYHTSASRLVMQTDGNLVLYNGQGKALWNTRTMGSGNNNSLKLQTDGNLVLYNTFGNALWNTHTWQYPDHLKYVNSVLPGPRAFIYPGQSIQTANREFKLTLQTDGNVVLYSPNRATWSSRTYHRNVSYLTLQPDGNLVLYDPSGKAIWDTRTMGSGGNNLIMQTDGNLVLYNSSGKAVWNTHTANVK